MTTRENFGTFDGSWLWPFVSEEGRRDGDSPRSRQCLVAGGTWTVHYKACGWKGCVGHLILPAMFAALNLLGSSCISSARLDTV